MRGVITFLVALLPLCGCAQTHQLGKLSAPEEVRFQELSADKVFTIAIDDGRLLRGRQLVVSADSLSWYNEARTHRYQASARRVKYIEFHDAAAGAKAGFGYGFLLGGVTGAVMAYSTGSDCDQSAWCVDRETAAPFAGLALGLLTGAVSSLVSAGNGVKHYYWVGSPGVVDPRGVAALAIPRGAFRTR